MGRYTNLQEIQSLDPQRDHVRIVYLTTGFEFPWDTTRSLEIALYRTYCVPSISQLLEQTGEFTKNAQKRYDDTALMIAELMKNGYDSPRGREILRRMNRIHGRYGISNNDYLYVLSTFVFEPIRWYDQFCWRKTDPKERQALFYFWREVGRRMGIKNIPDTFEDFKQFSEQFEKDNFEFYDSNRVIGTATRNLFLSWFPSFMGFLIKPSIYAMLDSNVLKAFGFPEPPHALRWLITTSLKLRGKAIRFFPARSGPAFITDGKPRQYPHGYQISDLGPENMLEWLNKNSNATDKQ